MKKSRVPQDLLEKLKEINEKLSFRPMTDSKSALSRAEENLELLNEIAVVPELEEFLTKFPAQIVGSFSPHYPSLSDRQPRGSLALVFKNEGCGLYYCRWTVIEPEEIIYTKVTKEFIATWQPESQKRLAVLNEEIVWKMIGTKILEVYGKLCGSQKGK